MSSAEISECGTYRYWLKRDAECSPDRGTALFCMLNPSTADATQDDPTIRRLRGYAKAWRANGLIVVNLYALRSTDPRALKTHADPVGPLNDYWMRTLVRECGDVLCAWGKNADRSRVRDALKLFSQEGARLFALDFSKDGTPKHPLYLRGDLIPQRWEPKP